MRVFALVAICALAGCRGDLHSRQPDAGRCLEPDPASHTGRANTSAALAARDHEATPSNLGGAQLEPRVLWQTELEWRGAQPGIAVAGDRVAVTVATRIVLLARSDGSLVATQHGSQYELLSAPVADDDGNFYFFSAAGLYALDAQGRPRWQRSEGDSRAPSDAPLAGALVLDPHAALILLSADGALHAVRAADGTPLWQAAMPRSARPVRRSMVGSGSRLFVSEVGAGVDNHIFDTSSGKPVQAPAGPKQLDVGIGWVSARAGLLGFRVTDDSSRFLQTATYAFDDCGRVRWTVPSGAMPTVMAGGDDLLLLGSSEQGEASLRVYSADGELKAGPRAVGTPIAVGVDGMIYAVDCGVGSSGAPRLSALSPSLEPQWTLPLGAGCPSPQAALADDGALYLLRSKEDGRAELIAVQTSSRGAAQSSWPMSRHDARGTSWSE